MGGVHGPCGLGTVEGPERFVPEVGREFTFRLPPSPGDDGVGYCRLIELIPPRLLVYTWRGGPYPDTLVRYEFVAEGAGTRLHFEHAGFDLNDPAQRRVYEITREGCEQKPYGWWAEFRDSNGEVLTPGAEEGSVTVDLSA